MVTLRRIFIGALVLVFGLACIFTLVLPFPRRIEDGRERYACRWDDGTQTLEDYFQALPYLCGATKEEIILKKEGQTGYIQTGEEFSRAVTVFERGVLAELLSFRLEGCNRIEHAALWQSYGNRCYYSQERFCWDGERFSYTERNRFDEVCLLTGNLPTSFLCDTGAEKLVLFGEASFTARSLVGSRVSSVTAHAPYFTESGAVYLQTLSGTRLVAALPNVESLELSCDYLDEGALAACTNLKSLKLPENYDGTLAMLFGATPVPEDLVLL